MSNAEKMLNILYSIVDEINEELPADGQLAKEPSTVLYGEDAAMDSMALVRLVVLYEEKINDDIGATICITDDRAMSMKNSPFRSIGVLSEYVAQLLAEEP